jgi:hypothetical protein
MTRTSVHTAIVLMALLLLGCGEPLRLPVGTVSPVGTPLISQAARQTATARAGAVASATAMAGTQTRVMFTATAIVSATAIAPSVTVVMPSPTTIVPSITTVAPSETAVVPSPTPGVVIVPATQRPRTNEERWREQQIDRTVLESKPLYTTRQPVPLLWWDPATGQALEIGLIRGDFPVQARFIFRPTGEQALEIPYTINRDFGLSSISQAVRDRMFAAGFTQTVEAFVVVVDGVEPRS